MPKLMKLKRSRKYYIVTEYDAYWAYYQDRNKALNDQQKLEYNRGSISSIITGYTNTKGLMTIPDVKRKY